jgi:hypothetical protein
MMPDHEYTEETKGSFTMKVVGGKLQFNTYDCAACKEAEIPHEVAEGIPHGVTDRWSHWGAGLPTTRRECMTCHRWDGPWVSADIVGGGW